MFIFDKTYELLTRLQKIFKPAGIYLFKVSNENIRTTYDICSKSTIKTK